MSSYRDQSPQLSYSFAVLDGVVGPHGPPRWTIIEQLYPEFLSGANLPPLLVVVSVIAAHWTAPPHNECTQSCEYCRSDLLSNLIYDLI